MEDRSVEAEGVDGAPFCLKHRVVDGQHVFSSDSIPELWVAHADKNLAIADVGNVLSRIKRLREEAGR